MTQEFARLKSFLNRPFPAISLKRKVINGIALGLIIFFVLYLFEPFGTYTYQDKWKVWMLAAYGLIAALTFIFLHLLLYWLFPQSFRKWNLWKDQLMFWGFVFLCSVFATIYHSAYFDNPLSLGYFFNFSNYTLTVALIPWLITFVIEWNRSVTTAIPKENEALIKDNEKPV
jgi:hypothetical protein